MCRSIDPERIPERVVVIRFDFRDQPKRPFWVLVQPPEPEVCVKHPGLRTDLVVTTETESLGKWQMGRLPLGEAMRARLIVFDGPPRLVRAFARWGGVGPFGEWERQPGRRLAAGESRY